MVVAQEAGGSNPLIHPQKLWDSRRSNQDKGVWVVMERNTVLSAFVTKNDRFLPTEYR